MPRYVVNRQAQSNGDHEVHEEGCRFMPHPANQLPLNYHASCHSAVVAARQFYPQSNGCATCCPACHTS